MFGCMQLCKYDRVGEDESIGRSVGEIGVIGWLMRKWGIGRVNDVRVSVRVRMSVAVDRCSCRWRWQLE